MNRYNQINIPKNISEHFDYAMKVEKSIQNMNKDIEISEKEVEEQINRFKVGKALGPDQIKPEPYKYMKDDAKFIKILTKSLDYCIQTGSILDN